MYFEPFDTEDNKVDTKLVCLFVNNLDMVHKIMAGLGF